MENDIVLPARLTRDQQDAEDYAAVVAIMAKVQRGEERVYSSEEVRDMLDLKD
ncbi:hypothetical protein AD47_2216 [Escherichia coli 6-319-05_S4_C3]|uniref:hypothetical protein n=1 Tax=Escherichia coli TaxID=562 RepID=UPI0004D6C11C|nr:hypothetical protein [Escherichia coli]KEM36393.1 hypothetical protein AD21_2168 [Escherichia coli 6-319-05_S4_C2]KEM67866.1 hypothetical protein AD47_2216 [Escherichia coli 6-319-05_S4_C3]